MKAVAAKPGIGTTETLRKWVRQDQVDSGNRPGVTSEESAELKRLKKEDAELRRANDILKAASFFAAGLNRPHTHSYATSSRRRRTAAGSRTWRLSRVASFVSFL